eukprot:gene4297-3113_t
MQHNFVAVDAELDDLEQDFASGEMNAFGNRETQHDFFGSFMRIANLEAEVFYKTCGILKADKAGEQAAFKGAMSMAKDPGGALGDSQRSGDTSTNLGATDNGAGGNGNTLNNGSFSATFRSNRFGVPWQQSSGEEKPFPSEVEEPFDAEPEHDKAFANVVKHFQFLESEFTNVSESLHDISREIIRIDLMAEKLNNAYHAEEGFDTNIP